MNRNEVRQISVHDLKSMIDNNEDIFVLDVREPDETSICSLGGENIPLGMIDVHTDKLPRDKKIIAHCRSGKRSYMACLFLQQEYEMENLYNLDGGIIAWASEIDRDMVLY